MCNVVVGCKLTQLYEDKMADLNLQICIYCMYNTDIGCKFVPYSRCQNCTSLQVTLRSPVPELVV